MNFILSFLDFVIHIDKHLILLIQDYGNLVYPLLFFIIFGETGLVITPFLPGDSLLFALGALSNEGKINIIFLGIILSIAALLGNTLNYYIGRYFGHHILQSNHKFLRKIIKKEYIDKTHDFFGKHGGKAVILSRFFPILRTFAPFVAGIGDMNIIRYSIYNIIGGVSWVTIILSLGYSFGTIPFIKNNFTLIVFGIIGISLLPAIYAIVVSKFSKDTDKISKDSVK